MQGGGCSLHLPACRQRWLARIFAFPVAMTLILYSAFGELASVLWEKIGCLDNCGCADKRRTKSVGDDGNRPGTIMANDVFFRANDASLQADNAFFRVDDIFPQADCHPPLHYGYDRAKGVRCTPRFFMLYYPTKATGRVWILKLMALDGNSIINRAFYGIRALNAPDGTPTNAVYGFLNILLKLIAEESPDALCVTFDLPGPTFRHAQYDEYKSHRKPMPEALALQMPIMKEVLDALNIPRYEQSGWEADDILGTLSKKCAEAGCECVIVTGDKDALQLVSDFTRIKHVKSQKGQTVTKNYTESAFVEEYGFTPEKMIDLKALMGDPSDNIPGVAGVGEKTAMDLVQRFGGIREIYGGLDALDIKDAVRKKLIAGKENADLSYDLAQIRCDAPVEFDVQNNLRREADNDELFAIFQRLGFKSLIEQFKLTPLAEAVEIYAPSVEEEGVGHNIKDIMRERLDRGEDPGAWIFDTALAAYLISPTDSTYDMTPPREVLQQKLKELGLERLYYDVELPLCRILAEMEHTGFLVDKNALTQFGEQLSHMIAETEREIYNHAGETFNINSPKQLGVILFEKLMLPAPKKTKTGYSTNVEVLDYLSGTHPVIALIKDYRELTKLKSTYADGLLKVIGHDGRIHTKFQMTVTATGRLSSTEPNLQNIPVRKALGGELRKMFISGDGNLLVDADYSQIELRLLAHIADDPIMKQAFEQGEDIHAVTASQVFGVALGDVTPLMRSRAKAVNFGIVYGISAFSLAKDIGVQPYEAKAYIESYLEKYAGVREYMARIVETAREQGYVETLFGRRRYLPELKAGNFNTRAFGERVALNMPIQGTAADIIKIAMINVSKRLEKTNAKLILQVHDELIAECPESEAEAIAAILREEMENAAQLSVPLSVEARSGKSWYDTK
jgi:DNA polymerase-1